MCALSSYHGTLYTHTLILSCFNILTFLSPFQLSWSLPSITNTDFLSLFLIFFSTLSVVQPSHHPCHTHTHTHTHTRCVQFYTLVQLNVLTCRSGGIDTRIHGLNIIGRVLMSEDEVAATFSFLTVEDLSQDSKSAKHRSKAEPEDVDSHFNKVQSNPSNLYSLPDSNDSTLYHLYTYMCVHIHTCTFFTVNRH